jgi:hypothetical protein
MGKYETICFEGDRRGTGKSNAFSDHHSVELMKMVRRNGVNCRSPNFLLLVNVRVHNFEKKLFGF